MFLMEHEYVIDKKNMLAAKCVTSNWIDSKRESWYTIKLSKLVKDDNSLKL